MTGEALRSKRTAPSKSRSRFASREKLASQVSISFQAHAGSAVGSSPFSRSSTRAASRSGVSSPLMGSTRHERHWGSRAARSK